MFNAPATTRGRTIWAAAWILGTIAVVVLVSVFTPVVLSVPDTAAGWLLWIVVLAAALVLFGLLIRAPGVLKVVAVVVLLALIVPLVISLIAGNVARSQLAAKQAACLIQVDNSHNGVPDWIDNHTSYGNCTQDQIAAGLAHLRASGVTPTTSAAATPQASISSTSAPASVPATTASPSATSSPAGAQTTAPAVAAQPVLITVPVGPQPRTFALSGVGDIPAGQKLAVFVRAPSPALAGSGQYFYQGDATVTGAHAWTISRVVLGSSDRCDDGQVYTVLVRLVDASTSIDAGGPNAGFTQQQWSDKFAGLPGDPAQVIRSGSGC